LLLGEHRRPRPQHDPSMLLSFERPASAGPREQSVAQRREQQARDPPALYASPGP
jgi:hypothetical protein